MIAKINLKSQLNDVSCSEIPNLCAIKNKIKKCSLDSPHVINKSQYTYYIRENNQMKLTDNIDPSATFYVCNNNKTINKINNEDNQYNENILAKDINEKPVIIINDILFILLKKNINHMKQSVFGNYVCTLDQISYTVMQIII